MSFDFSKKVEILPRLGTVDSSLRRAQAVTRFEKKHAFRFPKAYVDFIIEFGPGEVNRFLRIYAPETSKDCHLSMEELWSEFIADEKCEFYQSDMFPFARTVGGDLFLWNKCKRARPKGEMQVLFSLRSLPSPKPIADSFTELLQSVCVGRKFGVAASCSFQCFGAKMNVSKSQEATLEEVSRRLSAAKMLTKKKRNSGKNQGDD